jgi:hypothetical protein
MKDESKFLELRKIPDGLAIIMALIFYLGVNIDHEVKRESSFILSQKSNKS